MKYHLDISLSMWKGLYCNSPLNALLRFEQWKSLMFFSAPIGCLQYYTGPTGEVVSYAYVDDIAVSHLNNLQYTSCVRQEQGRSTIVWSVSTPSQWCFQSYGLKKTSNSQKLKACIMMISRESMEDPSWRNQIFLLMALHSRPQSRG